MTKLEAEPDLGPGFDVLVDRRQAEVATAEFVDGVVRYLRAHNERLAIARWATLVDGTAAYGMSRIVQTRLSDLPFPFEIFTEESSALAWLFRSHH